MYDRNFRVWQPMYVSYIERLGVGMRGCNLFLINQVTVSSHAIIEQQR